MAEDEPEDISWHEDGADVPVWAVVALVAAACWIVAGAAVLILTLN